MSYFDDWIDAFKEHPRYRACPLNLCDAQASFPIVQKNIKKADLVILHHSMSGDTLKYLTPLIPILQDRRGTLVSFVGNEVNLPTIGMAPKIKALQQLEPEIIITQLLQEAGEWLYADCKKSKILSLPHALNPRVFRPQRQLEQRTTDVGTRSARYGVYIGDNDRNNIIQFFHQNASKFNLSVDLGLDENSQKRFTRSEWALFLNSCKATLSTEAGSFYLERDDKLVHTIGTFLKKRSSKIVLSEESTSRKIYRKLVPSALRQIIVNLLKNKLVEIDHLDAECDFNELYALFFSKAQKTPVYSKAVSSRHFDAIGTKTLHIMYPGRYNDILKPGEHYFELKRDHSNMEEISDLLKDTHSINKITERTLEYVLSYHTHEHRLNQLLKALP